MARGELMTAQFGNRWHGLKTRVTGNSLAALAFALVAMSAMSSRTSAETAPPPNIVMIVSDDHAWTDYGFMGHPQIRTPHLD